MGEAISATITAPVFGMNTRDALDGMDARFGRNLKNVFCDGQKVSLRAGHSLFATGMGAGVVQTLAEHVSRTGTRKFLAGANNNIYDITSGTPSSVKSVGITNNRWQTVQANNRLLFFNGSDTPQQYDGTTISDITYTGIADSKKLVQATMYRGRLCAIEIDTLNLWYAGPGAFSGALTLFPLDYIFTLGGSLAWVTTWTRGWGDAPSETLVLCSTEGEIVIYSGSDPDSAGFQLIAHTYGPKPIGRRSFTQWGGELEIITQVGSVPLSRLLDRQGQATEITVTDKIGPSWAQDAESYKGNFGWQAQPYPLGKMMIYNVPTVSSGGTSKQWVRNLYTGAISCFSGLNAACWGMYNDQLYFGSGAGAVFKADTGQSDAGRNIDWQIDCAFNYAGDRQSLKHWHMARPIVAANGSMTLGLGIDVDFQNDGNVDTVVISQPAGAEWDTASWDQAEWADEEVYQNSWYEIPAIGRCGALKMRGAAQNLQFSMTAVHVTFSRGGIL